MATKVKEKLTLKSKEVPKAKPEKKPNRKDNLPYELKRKYPAIFEEASEK